MDGEDGPPTTHRVVVLSSVKVAVCVLPRAAHPLQHLVHLALEVDAAAAGVGGAAAVAVLLRGERQDVDHTWAWGGEGYRYPPPEGQSPNSPSCWTLY